MARDEEVLNTLLSKIYMILNAGDTITFTPRADSSYVSFCVPGIPIAQQDLTFGFNPTVAEIEAASGFADLVNNIPLPTGFWRTSTSKLHDQYKRVLNGAILAQSQLTQQEQEVLKRCNDALWSKSTVVDPISGEQVEILIDTPLYERYQKLKATYEAYRLSYNNLLINVQTNPNNPQVVADFNINGPIYRNRAIQAENQWRGAGANIVETALAQIAQFTGRDPSTLFAEARANLELSERLDTNGQAYYFTKYFPTNFFAAQDSWTKFVFKNSEVHTTSTATSTSWGGGGSVGFGLWSFGASASYSSQHSTYSSDASNLSVEVELTRVPLRRSWFRPNILTSKSWKSDPANPITLSDGGMPPQGELVGYMTEMILARKLNVGMDMSSTRDSQASSQFSSSASVGWGPFSLRGNYSRSTSTQSHDFTSNAGGFSCPGMQIIGFTYLMLPKAPNPDPAVPFPQ